LYAQSAGLAALVLTSAVVSVVWQLGVLTLLGFGMDPMSILVPFLVFAIAVSHGVQMVSSVRSDIFLGASSADAARASFRRLLVPGGIALATDTLGFFTILFIQIRVIQEIAIAASIGVAAIILIDLVLLPVLLSYFPFAPGYRDKLERRARHLKRMWTVLSAATERRPASAIVAVAVLLAVFGWWKGQQVQVGDLHRGVPELHADSRYNRDTAVITSKFSIGVDILNVIAETKPEGCVDHAVMTTIDEFAWHMENLPAVHSTIDLPRLAKQLNAGWNEGSPKWRVLSRNQSVLTQSVTYVPTTTGLLNSDCSVMPVMLFTEDHKAATIERIVREVKSFEAGHGNPDVSFKLATGNVGVMAATNEAVAAAQWPIMACVFGATILMCFVSFRSLPGTLAILLPLGLVSLLSYALMAMLDIGLKVSTLPVAALGVGIGVDYGIYLYGRFRGFRASGAGLRQAYAEALETTGSGVLFTGLSLTIGVSTWVLSPLKFQADMGLLLGFLFFTNMIGALVLLPALLHFLLGRERPGQA
jgi:predicted RND superfamily exporter protein